MGKSNKEIRDEAVKKVMRTLYATKNPVNEYIADAVIEKATAEDELLTIYKTPETCPRCMEELALEWAYCPECGRHTDWTREKEAELC